MAITKNVNLVVIGSGGAGLAAAVTAMQAGVDGITVLEKSHFLGGNSRMAGGILFTPESNVKADSPEQARDKVFREAIEFHHYTRVEPKILRAFLDNAQDTVNWLDESSLRGYKNIYPFGNFYKTIKKMAALLKQAGNEVLIDTCVTGIECDENGAVYAVTAKSSEKGELIYKTKAAMLATGGFTGNSELLHHYFPNDYDDCFYTDALPLDGDGIKLAKNAGAAMTDYCTIIKENAYSCDSRLDAPNRGAHQAKSLWVNGYGERFHDESKTADETANALVKQPNMLGYALFDENALVSIENTPFSMEDMPDMPFEIDDGGPGGMPFGMGMLREQLQAEAARGDGWCLEAGSLDEIATFIGANEDTLKETVEEYNAFCDAGRDGLFAKAPKNLVALRKAPYYALKFRPILIDTVGPVIVNGKMQVLDENHKPIPGLYAGGVITTGWQGVDYHLFGSALCYSLTSGRLAGRCIANQLNYI